MNPAQLQRMMRLAEHLYPLRAIRLAASLPQLSLIGVGTRLLPVSVIMPSYATALTAAVALGRRYWLCPNSTARRSTVSARKSRGQLRLVWSRPSP